MVHSVTLSSPTRSVTLTAPTRQHRESGELPFRIPGDGAFFSQKFIDAPEIARIAAELIATWPEFGGFDELEIKYVWQRKGTVKNGKATLGKCTKVSGLAEFFGECQYVIAIAADHCRAYDVDREKMTALVYHELCHILVDEDEETGDPILGIRGHDVEMFLSEIDRYGLWTADLEAAAKSFEQWSLFNAGAR